MKVMKRVVEQYEIQVGNSPVDEGILLNAEEARNLHIELGKQLGLPQFDALACDHRFSHSSHWWGSDVQHWCTGLAFDRT